MKVVLAAYVAIDEIWVYHFTPESKKKSKLLIGMEELCPKKADSTSVLK